MSFFSHLQRLQDEIYVLAKRLHRNPHDITIIAVSKNATLEQMQQAYSAGIRDFGESRLQLALKKQKELPKDIVWHFVGPIQSNKAKEIAKFFDVIHSVGSLAVAKIISKTAVLLNKQISCFIQVNLTQEKNKQGFSKEELLQELQQIKSLPNLRLLGLMVIGPHTQKQEKIVQCFHQAALLSAETLPGFLSMGMSSDYPLAIAQGATHLRIGSLLFSIDENQN